MSKEREKTMKEEEMAGINVTSKPSGNCCVECLAAGGWWLHLRRFAECGHIGCCDNSDRADASQTLGWRSRQALAPRGRPKRQAPASPRRSAASPPPCEIVASTPCSSLLWLVLKCPRFTFVDTIMCPQRSSCLPTKTLSTRPQPDSTGRLPDSHYS